MTPLIPMATASVVAFWVLAPLAVLLALGMVLARKPVHSALSLAGMMICLAILYATLQAPLLFVVQIIVYTGAIMMLFLFVVMLVGVGSSDSTIETIKGHRVAAVIAVLGLLGLLAFTVGGTIQRAPVGLDGATAPFGGNVQALADLFFGRYVFLFLATSGLLIIGAVGAMVLAHGERIVPKLGQRETAARRLQAYANDGSHLGPLPASGVFARHNAIQTPALLPDGSVSELSVSKTLAERGAFVDADELRAPTREAFRAISEARGHDAGELE
ncbi:NADH-quinone oxidoreductase subunit J [Aestuariimicrobium ganziense]|uniref:NADH-quinone oxidoreductase subunit J n=1 Tax=Aestuariimicrobium ganziense TaxID=2773677 RepID=UPI00194110BD|nr:NADH-quinone oxidoreductase subunit J [Aestuariimicrobium ganziense]